MMATTVIQPIDTIKVRIQIRGEELGAGAKISPAQISKEIMAQQGIKGFYQGLDSALFRQATYATARLGIFRTINDTLKAKNKSNKFLLQMSKVV